MLYIFLILLFLFFCNEVVKRLSWYTQVFGDILKFKNLSNHLDIVNLGSNTGKYGFDYHVCDKNGANWAVGPQALEYDLYILRKYAQNIASRGIVLIPIVQFSSILDRYTDVRLYDKYHLILDAKDIPCYSLKAKRMMKLYIAFPLLRIFVNPFSFASFLLGRSRLVGLSYNPMGAVELQKDAERWIDGWKRQFGIKELGEDLSREHIIAIEKNQQIVMEMVKFCKERELRPFLVLPPVTKYLNRYFTTAVKERYIYSFIRSVREKVDIPILDYMNDLNLSDEDLFFNSFFLNAKGRKIFTEKVLNDIYTVNK